jgi:uncharacterized protein (DUF2249 family)
MNHNELQVDFRQLSPVGQEHLLAGMIDGMPEGGHFLLVSDFDPDPVLAANSRVRAGEVFIERITQRSPWWLRLTLVPRLKRA